MTSLLFHPSLLLTIIILTYLILLLNAVATVVGLMFVSMLSLVKPRKLLLLFLEGYVHNRNSCRFTFLVLVLLWILLKITCWIISFYLIPNYNYPWNIFITIIPSHLFLILVDSISLLYPPNLESLKSSLNNNNHNNVIQIVSHYNILFI